jgi:hypothetical protein
MKARRFAISTLALLTATTAFPATTLVQSQSAHSTLHVFGGRSLLQRQGDATEKLDAALADLTRHLSLVRSGHALADLHSLNPAARFAMGTPNGTALVLIDAVTRGDPQKLRTALMGLGLQRSAVYANDVSGWLPIDQIDSAAARGELHSIRASMPRTRAGAVTTQGDFAQGSATIRTTYSTLTGAGVTVGILSDSFNCYGTYESPNSGVPAPGPRGYAPNGFLADAAQDVKTGDLPSTVKVLKDAPCPQYGQPIFTPFTDEGRAMLQVVHDIAPGASLQFYTAENGEAGFADGITMLAGAGAQVIADDVGYYTEPFFQDGLIAEAINSVEAQGVAYFSAAGNNANNAYDNLTPAFNTLSNSSPNAGEYLLNFDASASSTTTSLPVSIPALEAGEFVALVLQWDQPYVTGAAGSPGASSRIDLCLTGASGGDLVLNNDLQTATCTGANATGKDPVQVLIIGNPASADTNSAATNINVMVGLVSGSPAPGRIKLSVEDNGAGAIIGNGTVSNPTIQGHANAATGAAVGAANYLKTPACGTPTAQLETYSSAGGTPILFDTSGNRLTAPENRQKPDFVGPDGVSNTFLGQKQTTGKTSPTAQCDYTSSFPLFFGTSAATPHAAAIAALMLQANPAITPTQIYTALRSTAAAMGNSTPNSSSGYGLIQANVALASLPPGAPTLSLSATSIAVGSSATLTWSSINTTACTASGDWTGAQSTSGSVTITPSGTGTLTYTLTCSNGVGSQASTQSLTVTSTPTGSTTGSTSGGGGGGAMGSLTLLALAASCLARQLRRRYV